MGLGAYYLAMSKDKSFILPKYDPDEVFQIDSKNSSNKDDANFKIAEQQTKKLLLIRHGESIWNKVFNRGFDLHFPFRFLYALIKETVLFVTSDSCFFDSPLSKIGVQQAYDLRQQILDNQKNILSNENDENQALLASDNSSSLTMDYLKIMGPQTKKGSECRSKIISSPLRRCIETVSLGCFDRLDESGEQIHLVSSLQEMTRNVDGLSLSYVNELPPLSWSMRQLENTFDVDWELWFNTRLNVSEKDGFKCLQRRGDDRMRSFTQYLFSSVNQDVDTFIVSGHSLWNRMFFRAFLPKNCMHAGKNQKICNGGVVACDFTKYRLVNGMTRYRIDPKSIQIVFKGFQPIPKKKYA